MAKSDIHVIISLDVEEEGLFSGKYDSKSPKVGNVALLPRLAPLSAELGFPLTLLCAYSVFSDSGSRKVLEYMRDHLGAEIGAHLHHWSTPPLRAASAGTPERTHKLPRDLLLARLETLLKAGENFHGAPLTSFRMGRWDLKSPLLSMLADSGITVDSSICPLRTFANGANHFLAPADPYWHVAANGARILEAPITQIPVARQLPRLWHYLCHKNVAFLDSFHFFGALSANPLWHGEKIMRMAVKKHVGRGGQILNLFWHSSEMMPGGSPHVPDQESADRLLKKIFSFCRWLNANYNVHGISMNKLPALELQPGYPILEFDPDRDW